LDQAIETAANEIDSSFSSGVIVTVINFNSSSEKLSDYVVEELIGKLVKNKKLVVVDRNNLELINEELEFQESGDVSDDSAREI
jgi:TolB-like protein